MRKKRIVKAAAILCAGGMLTQLGACATVLAPTFLGFGENLLLSFLLGQAGGL